MIARSYKFKFYLNARHVLNLPNGRPIVHPHTWELTMLLVKEREGFVQFGQIEAKIVEFLAAYENTLLNSHPSFQNVEPSTEAIGEVFYKRLNQDLMDIGWKITSIEVSENPARTYSIEDKSYHFNGFNPFSNLKVEVDDGNNQWKSGSGIGLGEDRIPTQAEKESTEQSESKELNALLEEFRSLTRIIRGELADSSVAEAGLGSHKSGLDNCDTAEVAADYARAGTKQEEGLRLLQLKDSIQQTAEAIRPVGQQISPLIERHQSSTHDRASHSTKPAEHDSPELCLPENASTPDPRGEGTAGPQPKEAEASDSGSRSRTVAPVKKTLWEKLTGRRITVEFWHVFTLLTYAGFLTALYFWIFRTGQYPWGSDTWGHLFKGHFLYEQVCNGNLYPLYTSLWYNGIQPFRYWAPIPYYLLLLLELITGGDSLAVYNIFIGAVFLIGAVPWLIMGRRFNRPYLGTLLGIIWFILPDNLRVFFCEGNLPRVVVTTLFPYLLMTVLDHLETKRRMSLVSIYLLMLVMTLCHAMISAMTGLTIFLFLVCYGVAYKEIKSPVMILTSALLGIVTSGVWLYPALKGGIVSLDSSAASAVMERLTYHISQSLNPLLRMDANLSDSFYFGVSVLFIALLGILTGDRFAKVLFGMTVIIFLGTTKAMLPIIRKLPMNDLFWMMRFTPMAMAFFLAGLLRWESARKSVMKVFAVLVIIEGLMTLDIIDLSQMSSRLYGEIQEAGRLSVQRIAMLDLSTFDSDSSFSITYGQGDKRLRQTFGWAWQGASTADNMVWINTALTKGYYTYVFDRCLELGADTLMVRKTLIKNRAELISAATLAGYRFVREQESTYLFQYPVQSRFATKVEYRGLAIGRYASNITYAFPSFQTAEEPYLDAYTSEELSQYRTVFLSGFKYHDKAKAEELVRSLAAKGVRVVVDLAGQESDLLSGRAEFLGVMGEPIQFKGRIPKLIVGDNSYYLSNLPDELKQWNTCHLVNLDHSSGSASFEDGQYDFWGSKGGDNVTFIGFNLPYYISEVRDVRAIALMEQVLGMRAEFGPSRRVVDIKEYWPNANEMMIVAPKGTLLDVAWLDAFETVGSFEVVHNLVKMTDKSVTIRITYPYLRQGLIISAVGAAGFLVFLWLISAGVYRGKRRKKDGDFLDV